MKLHVGLSLAVSLCLMISSPSAIYASSQIGQAKTSQQVEDQAIQMGLAQHPKWHHLMHYYSPVLWGELRSYVDDEAFFLSPKGKYDPEAELRATLQAFFKPGPEGNEHAICLFPARYAWLEETLSFANQLPKQPDCEQYNAWRDKVNATRLSLIFPSAYINSPSSMFGHTLFRFDPEDVEQGSDWLSWSLSFGADIDASDNSIAFAYRGIFGGYPGIYSMMHYFEKIKEYNHLENRDIWEYELDINAEGVDDMLSHTWELKNVEFDYFFLDENCAFRLLEQIELARSDISLLNQFEYTAIPSNTVRAIADSGLVRSANFQPSATTKLKAEINQLTEDEQHTARDLSEDISVLESEAYLNLSPERQAKVVQVAYSFLRYQQLKRVRDSDIAKRSHTLLLTLNQLPAKEAEVAIPERPEKGHKTELVAISSGFEDEDEYLQLEYRATYHDLLDNPLGYPQGAHIVMGNTQARYRDDQFYLERFDFINIISLSEMDTFFSAPSWHVKTGYENVWLRSGEPGLTQAGATYVKAGFGASYRVTENLLMYGFVDGRLEHNKYYEPLLSFAPGLSGGVLSYNALGTAHLSLAAEYFSPQDEYRLYANLEQNIPFDINNAIRIGVSPEWHRDEHLYEVSVSYRHHF